MPLSPLQTPAIAAPPLPSVLAATAQLLFHSITGVVLLALIPEALLYSASRTGKSATEIAGVLLGDLADGKRLTAALNS